LPDRDLLPCCPILFKSTAETDRAGHRGVGFYDDLAALLSPHPIPKSDGKGKGWNGEGDGEVGITNGEHPCFAAPLSENEGGGVNESIKYGERNVYIDV
jgi:hypothetical protein